MPKFKPHSFSDRKMQILWLRFLTEINENTRDVPAELLENAEVSEALEIVERAAFDDADMLRYDKFWDRVSVQRTLEEAMKSQVEETEAKRIEAEAKRIETEAKVEEAEAKLVDTARKMKADGLPVDIIVKYTGFSREDIEHV